PEGGESVVSEPPLASVDLELQRETITATAEAALPRAAELEEEEKLKEAIKVVERESLSEPLPAESPLVTEHVIVSPVEKRSPAAAPVIQPLSAVLASPHGSESVESETQVKEVVVPEKKALIDEKKVPLSLGSFKEESNKTSDLTNIELKSLEDLKRLVETAVNDGTLSETSAPHQEISIWGVPLLQDNRTDVVLLKFLRARDFKVNDSFTMLKNTIKWRKEFNI
ncbi:hypothetical protein M569_15842, partial [Genlisea aurea]